MLPLREYLAIGKLLALLGAVALICAQSSLIHKWHTQTIHSEEARQLDRSIYIQAQKDATQTNIAQVQKVEQQYQRNSENERQAYLSDLAKLRAMRVRPQAPAAPSPTGPTSPPASSAPTSGADGDGLRLSPDQYLQAQEIELRLMHIQNWIETQMSVDPNK